MKWVFKREEGTQTFILAVTKEGKVLFLTEGYLDIIWFTVFGIALYVVSQSGGNFNILWIAVPLILNRWLEGRLKKTWLPPKN